MDDIEDWSDAEILEEIDEKGEGLTPWELAFVEDVTVALRKGGELTLVQRDKLLQIHEERVP